MPQYYRNTPDANCMYKVTSNLKSQETFINVFCGPDGSELCTWLTSLLDANNPISKIQAINKNCHFMFHLFSKKWLFYKCMNDMFHINFNIFAKSRLLIFLFGTLSDADSKQGSVWTSRLLGKQLTTLKDNKKKWKIYCLWPFVLGQQTDDSNQVGRNRWHSRPATLMDRHLQNICNLCWSKPQFFRWW